MNFCSNCDNLCYIKLDSNEEDKTNLESLMSELENAKEEECESCAI